MGVVFMVVTVVFMVMESVRLRLSPRLLLTLGIMEDMATLDLDLDMVVMDILVLDMLDLDIEVSMVMESVRLRLSPRLLLTLGIMEDMATLDLDMVVMDILVLDILVFMVVTVVFMVMESVRLKLSLRLLLIPGCMEDMDLDMEVMDIPVLDILVLDILAFMVMDGVVKKYLKSRTPIHTDCHIPFRIVHKLSE